MGKYENKAHNWRIRSYFAIGGIVDRYKILGRKYGRFCGFCRGVDALRVDALRVEAVTGRKW